MGTVPLAQRSLAATSDPQEELSCRHVYTPAVGLTSSLGSMPMPRPTAEDPIKLAVSRRGGPRLPLEVQQIICAILPNSTLNCRNVGRVSHGLVNFKVTADTQAAAASKPPGQPFDKDIQQVNQ